MQSGICGDALTGTEIDDKSAGTVSLGKSADVDAVLGIKLEIKSGSTRFKQYF